MFMRLVRWNQRQSDRICRRLDHVPGRFGPGFVVCRRCGRTVRL